MSAESPEDLIKRLVDVADLTIDDKLAEKIAMVDSPKLTIWHARFLGRQAFRRVVTKRGLTHLRMTWLQIVEPSSETLKAWEVYPEADIGLVLRAIAANPGSNEDVTTVAFAAIEDAVDLKSLRINRSYELTDAAMASIARLKKLQELEFEDTQLSDGGLANLGELPELESVSLEFSFELTGEGFADWRNTDVLRQLYLECCPLTDKGLLQVLKFPNLERLMLNQCATVSWDAIRRMAELPKLRETSLALDAHDKKGCHISFEMLREFVEACPSLRSIWSYPSTISNDEEIEIGAILDRRPK